MARTIRVRKGTGEYRVPAALVYFTVPTHAKEMFSVIKERLGMKQQEIFGEALDDFLVKHKMPPLGIRSMKNEPDLD